MEKYKCIICGKIDNVKNLEVEYTDSATWYRHKECQKIYELGSNPYWIAKTLLELKNK